MLQRIVNRDCKDGKTGRCEYTWGTEVSDPICVGTEVPVPFWGFSQKSGFEGLFGDGGTCPLRPQYLYDKKRQGCLVSEHC